MMKTVVRPRVNRASIERIYRQEARHRGKIVAIEPESGEYFIGETGMEALRKARRRFPGRSFVFKRIGFRWTHRQAGGLKRIAR